MLRITDIQNNSVNWNSVPFVQIDEDKAEDYLLYSGNILFARTGATVGKSFLIESLNEKYVFASYLIRIQSSQNIYVKYVRHFLESGFYWEQITEKSVGTGQPNVNGTILGELVIPLPPFAEQQRIVAEIEQLFALIDTVEESRLSLEQLVKQAKSKVLDLAIRGKLVPQSPDDEPASALLERIRKAQKGKQTTTDTFHYPFEIPTSWEWCRLGEIFEIIMGQSPSGNSISKNKAGIEFHQGKIYFTEKYIKGSEVYTTNPTKIITERSVLLCVRAPVGFVNISTQTICIGRGLCAVIPRQDMSVNFVFYWLKTLEKIFVEKSTGSTFQAISMNTVKESIIPLPPLAEQQRIVLQIEKIFALLDEIKKAVEA